MKPYFFLPFLPPFFPSSLPSFLLSFTNRGPPLRPCHTRQVLQSSCFPAWLARVECESISHPSQICSMLPNTPHPLCSLWHFVEGQKKKKNTTCWMKAGRITKKKNKPHILDVISSFHPISSLAKTLSADQWSRLGKGKITDAVQTYVLSFVHFSNLVVPMRHLQSC